MRALEAIRPVAREWGISSSALRPCLAYYLDGGALLAERHATLFAVGILLRDVGFDRRAVELALRRWAKSAGYRDARVEGVASGVFLKAGNDWKYRAPGLRKHSRAWRDTLRPLCQAVGCPSNCPPLYRVRGGDPEEGIDRYIASGWPEFLRKNRWRGADDLYRALCRLEADRGFGTGATLLASYEELGRRSNMDKTNVGKCLRRLVSLELVSCRVGSGSGPHARDRRASEIARTIPIPFVPS